MRMDTCVTCLCALKMWLWVSVVLYDNSLSRLLSGEGAKVRLVVSFIALFTRVGWGSGLYWKRPSILCTYSIFFVKSCALFSVQTKWSSSSMNVYFTLVWGKQCKQVMPNYGQCPDYFGSRLKYVSDMSILPYAALSISAHRRQNSLIHCHAYHPWCRNPAAIE